MGPAKIEMPISDSIITETVSNFYVGAIPVDSSPRLLTKKSLDSSGKPGEEHWITIIIYTRSAHIFSSKRNERFLAKYLIEKFE